MAKVKTQDLAQALLQMTEGKSTEETKKTLTEFVQYLAKKGLLGEGDKIAEAYRELYNNKHGIVEATVTLLNRLPHTVMKDIEESLKKKYKAHKVHLTEKIDQRILGGVKIKVGDTVYDSTLKNTLSQLQATLLK